MPGPVEATSSTLDVAHEDNVWNNQKKKKHQCGEHTPNLNANGSEA